MISVEYDLGYLFGMGLVCFSGICFFGICLACLLEYDWYVCVVSVWCLFGMVFGIGLECILYVFSICLVCLFVVSF